MASLKYPPTRNGVQKTLDAQLDSGVTASLTLNNVTGIQNKAGVVVINRIDTNGAEKDPSLREYIIYTGTSGNTLTGLTRNADSSTSDQDHAVGSVVEFIPDVLWGQAIIDALANLVDPSTGAVDTTKVVTPTGTQTLTNKTFTSPVLNTGVSGTAVDTDETLAANSDTLLASQKAVKTYVTNNAGGAWTTYSAVTPTTGTLDDPSFPIVFAGVDLTSVLTVGMKVRITQSTVKYFIITKVAFSTDTTVTLYGGTDYDLVASGTTAISAFAYSGYRVPVGFPMSPAKWQVKVTDTTQRTQATPSAGTWYNLNSAEQISIPIGVWEVDYQVTAQVQDSGATQVDIYTTLSTANNTESDKEFTSLIQITGASGNPNNVMTSIRSKVLDLSSKTSYFLNSKTDNSGITQLDHRNDLATLVIKAVCAYL